jgi:hypothetical protein
MCSAWDFVRAFMNSGQSVGSTDQMTCSRPNSGSIFFRSVPDYFAFDHVNDVFGYICRMVGNSFKVT